MGMYISLLRGINVAGKNLIKMSSLKELFEQLGFESVTTYLQSGNAVFSCKETDKAEIGTKITNKIFKIFGYNVPVLVLTPEELRNLKEECPFINQPDMDPSFFHVTLMHTAVTADHLKVLNEKLLIGEVMDLKGSVLYLYCPHGYGKTKLSNSYIEKKLNVMATTRNWNTIIALNDLINEV
jgi:uncharacterized protein (DUF1697 family)